MRGQHFLLLSLAFLVFLFPLHARACEAPCNSCTPPYAQGTTHIVGISPQVGIAGVTQVYINGYCFGDSQGNGTVTVNGEPMGSIVSWSDAEIESRVCRGVAGSWIRTVSGGMTILGCGARG